MEDFLEFQQVLGIVHSNLNFNKFLSDFETYTVMSCETNLTETCKSLEAGFKISKDFLNSKAPRDLTTQKAILQHNSVLDENILVKITQLCEKVLSSTALCEQSPTIIKRCYELLSVVFPELSIGKQSDLLVQCITRLNVYLQQPEGTCIPAFTTLLHSLHDIIIKHSCEFKLVCEALINILHKSLTVDNDQMCVTTLSYILSLALKTKLQSVKDIHEIGHELWNEIKIIFAAYCQRHFKDYLESTIMSERPFTILCASSILFFSPCALPVLSSILSDENIWTIIQHGFFHANPLTRKRSLFILKRIVDIMQQEAGNTNFTKQCSDRVPKHWWEVNHRAEILNMWNDMFLLIETLEEKQVHVIKPVMPKLNGLIKATFEQSGHKPTLHTSWILSLFQRIASHESSYIKRWGMSEFLKLDLNQCPLYRQGGHRFLTEPFIAMLTESTIYYKPAELNLGKCPPIAEDLAKFFRATFIAVQEEQRGNLLIDMLKSINKFCWSGAALLYVIRGMSFIERNQIMHNDGLLVIKEMLVSVATSVEPHFRGAIQQYFCSIVHNLIDYSSVSVADVASFLGSLSGTECLKRGTVVWSRVLCPWLYDTVKEGQGGEQWQETRVCQSIEASLQASLMSETFLIEGSTGVVRLLLLAVDSGLLPISDNSSPERSHSLLSILHPVLEMLSSVGKRLYLSAEKADASFLLFNSLCREAQQYNGGQDDLFKLLVSVITPDLITSVLQYVNRRICEVSVVDDLEKVSILCETIRHVSSINGKDFENSAGLHSLVQQCLPLIKDTSQSSQQSQVQRCTGMLVLSSLCQTDCVGMITPLLKESFSSSVICSDFRKPQDLQSKQGDQKDFSHIDWGRVASVFLEAQWQCIHSVLNHHSPEDMASYGPHVSVAMDVLGGLSLLPVFKCAVLLIPKVTDEMRLDWLTLSWKRTEEQTKWSGFWSMYNTFVEVLVKIASLSPGATSPLQSTLKEICDEIFQQGEEKMGLVNGLMTALYMWWEKSPNGINNALRYSDIIVRSVYFGEIPSKGTRFKAEVYHYLEKCGEELSVNQLLNHTRKVDAMVRVCTLTFLSKLRPDNPVHRELAVGIVNSLFIFYNGFLSNTGYRNFGNSLSHRKKHRMFCAVMVLHHFLEEVEGGLFEFLIKGLLFENQPSVRHQLEWLLTRLLHKQQQYMPQFWSHFDVAGEKKPVLMCSLLLVLTSLAKLQPQSTKQTFLLETIPKVFPWATVQQFNIRLFAQGFLLMSWKMSVEQHLTEVLTKHAILQSFLDFCQKNEHTKKGTQKLLENFVYSIDPFEDFTIENIVSTIPYLCGLTDEEWISVEKFESVAETWDIEGQHSIQLKGKSALRNCKPGSWKVKYSGYDEDWVEHTSDVQKKVSPWKQMLPEQDLEPGLQEEYVQKRQSTGGLVLVASLIDKIPNLGGLCRTSEIFGVSEYVLSSLHHVKDKGFQSLSVTSHKWLPIKEVKPHYLKMYLLEMREAGYTVVGAEQTANSVSPTSYHFPKKTVLILGNEKEGIPVDIIQLLDVCVEIPQQGLVRSLNVHFQGSCVTGQGLKHYLLQELNTCTNYAQDMLSFDQISPVHNKFIPRPDQI